MTKKIAFLLVNIML